MMTADHVVTAADPDRVVYYPSRRKMAILLVGGLGFVSVGIWIASGGAEGIAAWKGFMAVYVGIPMFGGCALYALYRLLRPRPALIIDRSGITDDSTALAVGLIPWGEIDHLVLHRYMDQPMLGVVLRDLDGWAARLDPLRRMSVKSAVGLGIPPVNIPQISIDLPLEALAELLHAKHGVRIER